MALEVDDEGAVVAGGVQAPSAGGPALLGVEAVGDGHIHEAVVPAGAGEQLPVGPPLQATRTANQSLPERCLAHEVRSPKVPRDVSSYPRRNSSDAPTAAAS